MSLVKFSVPSITIGKILDLFEVIVILLLLVALALKIVAFIMKKIRKRKVSQ